MTDEGSDVTIHVELVLGDLEYLYSLIQPDVNKTIELLKTQRETMPDSVRERYERHLDRIVGIGKKITTAIKDKIIQQ